MTNLILVGGSLYLVQLARNYSQTSTIIPFLFLLAMFFEYVFIAFFTIRNTLYLKRLLAELVSPDTLHDIPDACHESILLKYK